MEAVRSGWLVGADGLYGQTENGWSRLGRGGFVVTAILRQSDRLVAGGEGGLWHLPADDTGWVQGHDETLTNVHAVTVAPEPAGLCAGSAYGVATRWTDGLGAWRWAWHVEGLTVNQRYTNALLADPAGGPRWLVGTEAGLLTWSESRWGFTSLMGRPVRALHHVQGCFWAGVDGAGVWTSADGESWSLAGQGLADSSVFGLAWAGDRLLAGTDRGVAVGDGRGGWHGSGAPLRVTAVGAAAEIWMAGTWPGGLWVSTDHGGQWRQSGAFTTVRTLAPPQGA
jgi:hypothetical protein